MWLSRLLVLGLGYGVIQADLTVSLAAERPPAVVPRRATAPPPLVPLGQGPRIEFKSLVHDFGRIPAGKPLKYTFEFTNTGDQTLQISNVRTSCGCTTAGDWKRRVAPGEAGSIPIQVNTSSLRGSIFKTITVSSNDPRKPQTTLSLKGKIWRALEITPSYVVFNRATREGASEPRTVKIVSNVEHPIELSALQCSSPAFQAELKTVRPGKEFNVVVRTVAPLPYGSTHGVISLKSSLPTMPVVTLQAYALVQKPVLVTPSRLTLQSSPLRAPTRRTVSIRNGGKEPLRISEPQVDVPGVTVQLSERQRGKLFLMQLNFSQSFEIPPGQQATLTFKTSHPEFRVVKVPIIQRRVARATSTPRAPRRLPPVPTAPRK